MMSELTTPDGSNNNSWVPPSLLYLYQSNSALGVMASVRASKMYVRPSMTIVVVPLTSVSAPKSVVTAGDVADAPLPASSR